ncbi:hypothetical protein [Nostoc punctiforme]|uniref:hypothetical protein n=1 Tax=Nostoc punctiforme TaxID=272131 RepID=UPI000038D10C|nr:hypothetical protein [Nostoc punctiforme]
MNLYENMLIELQNEYGDIFTVIRLLWIDPSGTDIVTIDLNNSKAFPVLQRAEEIETALAE